MGTRTVVIPSRTVVKPCCDVKPTATRQLRTYQILIREIDTSSQLFLQAKDAADRAGATELIVVFERQKLLCPWAFKRLLGFIERATTPPGKPEATENVKG